MRKFFAIIIICNYHAATAQAKEKIKVTDMLQIKSISNITITGMEAKLRSPY